MTMDRGTIIKLARDAGGADITRKGDYHFTVEQIERFANLVAEYVIKAAPDYKMGYADGVATEREELIAFMKERENT